MFIQPVHIKFIPLGKLERNGIRFPAQNYGHHLKLYFRLETARVRMDQVKTLLTDYPNGLLIPGLTS